MSHYILGNEYHHVLGGCATYHRSGVNALDTEWNGIITTRLFLSYLQTVQDQLCADCFLHSCVQGMRVRDIFLSKIETIVIYCLLHTTKQENNTFTPQMMKQSQQNHYTEWNGIITIRSFLSYLQTVQNPAVCRLSVIL